MDILYDIALNQAEKRRVIEETAEKLNKLGVSIEKVDYHRGCIVLKPLHKVWIITVNEFYKWNKGRTYYYHKAIYHSDYKIKNVKTGVEKVNE